MVLLITGIYISVAWNAHEEKRFNLYFCLSKKGFFFYLRKKKRTSGEYDSFFSDGDECPLLQQRMFDLS